MKSSGEYSHQGEPCCWVQCKANWHHRFRGLAGRIVDRVRSEQKAGLARRNFHLAAATWHQGASTSATRPGSSRFLGCRRAPRGAFRLCRFPRRGRASRSGAARSGASRLPRERCARRRAARLTLENPRHRTRNTRPSPGLALALASLVGVFGAAAGARLGFAFPWRTKCNASAPCLG